MKKDNFLKLIHGLKGIKAVEVLLKIYKEKGYIKYKKPFRTGYKGKKDQFYFPFLIKFTDGERWLVQSTTTYPRERVGTYHWNAQHIKLIEPNIKKAIVVYPDSADEEDIINLKKYQKSIKDEEIISQIDEVISLSELSDLIEEKALQHTGQGKQLATRGINFEELLVEVFNNQSNIEKWNTNDPTEVGFEYPIFKTALKKFGINKNKIISRIDATNKIPLLPPSPTQIKGGPPKTDIRLTIYFDDDTTSDFRLSLKKTGADWVSVHEYTAQQFVDVLQIDDASLIIALYKFQEVGNMGGLDPHNKEALETKLKKYNKPLTLWVYGGIGGPGEPKIHWANYICIYDVENKKFGIWNIEDYVKKVLEVNGNFNTPFRWTHPSKKRGKSIQLKGKVFMN